MVLVGFILSALAHVLCNPYSDSALFTDAVSNSINGLLAIPGKPKQTPNGRQTFKKEES
jgi:hypothetical protein